MRRPPSKKASFSSSMEFDQIDDKHAAFTEWSRTHGVEINGVKPAKLPGRGLGLVTTKKLKDGDRILFVPEKAMFKPDTAMLKREDLEFASPQAHLAVSALLAFRDGDSRLALWRDTWPTHADFRQSMPMCWPHNLRPLFPPAVEQPLERQSADYGKDWKAVEKLCSDRHLSEDDFKYYWMIVNSRSFHWKPPHSKSGSMVMCPFIDYINHGPTGSTCRVIQGDKGYEVTATRNHDIGEEVLATYGAHSNDKLLVHYGFVCSTTPDGPSADDDIRLDHLILPKLDNSTRNQLQDVGFLGSYALLPATNELCFKTQVAVRAKLLTCNEWEYFASYGEDLSDDQTSIVNDFVRELLVGYRGEAVDKLKALQEFEGEERAKDMLGLRWRQIVDAIDAFHKA